MLLGNKGFGTAHIPALDMFLHQFNHTDWIGIRLIDLVFPSFLFIVGVAMPFFSGPYWDKWVIMVMPPGAFFMLAVVVWVLRSLPGQPRSTETTL